MSTHVGTLHELEDRLMTVRHAVFVVEQSVPAEIERDDRDEFCQHVAVCADGHPIATGRIDVADGGRLGRIAVVKEYRGRGVGMQVVHTLEQIAKDADQTETWLHSQVSAIPFYRRLGYDSEGEVYLEGGIEHMTMRKLLSPQL